MNALLKIALAMAGTAIATQAVADVTFYENENYQGRTFTAKKPVNNFRSAGFNDRASSIVVLRDRWEACEDVRSVRAVVGPAAQRCWIEREQISQAQGNTSVSQAIAGILGFQVDAAQPQYQDVQRCATAPSQRPDHWDVTYIFRSQEHRMQMTAPPGRTVTVNANGEPRA